MSTRSGLSGADVPLEVQVLLVDSSNIGLCFLENGAYASGVRHILMHGRNTTVVVHRGQLEFPDIFDVLLSTVDAVLCVFDMSDKYSLKALRTAFRSHPLLSSAPSVLVGLSSSTAKQAQARRMGMKARRLQSDLNFYKYIEVNLEGTDDDTSGVFKDLVQAASDGPAYEDVPALSATSSDFSSHPPIIRSSPIPTSELMRPKAAERRGSSPRIEKVGKVDKTDKGTGGRKSKKEIKKMKRAEKKKLKATLTDSHDEEPPIALNSEWQGGDGLSGQEIELRDWLSDISEPMAKIAPALAKNHLSKELIKEEYKTNSTLLRSVLLECGASEGQILRLFGKLMAEDHQRVEAMKKKMFVPRGKATMMYEELEVKSTIGGGFFGEVFKGRWREANVAIKQLRSRNSTSSQKRNFLREAELMMNLERHPNVVTCYGACSDPFDNLYIVMEFASDGSLSECLLNSTELIDTVSLLRIASGVAAGMSHLARNKIVHRDIAARNVLLQVGGFSKQRLVYIPKISDFGLARALSDRAHIKTAPGEKMAVRWMPPEFFTEKTFSLKGDVWSIGVCLWEIFSGGRMLPYVECASLAVVKQAILEGRQLARPDHTPSEVYELMRACSHVGRRNPAERPDMEAVLSKIQHILTEYQSSESTSDDPSTALDDENYAK